ncbi:MAG TPA: dTMP kinase [Sphingomonas sp.]
MQLAPLIAVVGCDGSGKSTVSAALVEWLRGYRPTDSAHLGLKSGDLGRAIARLPLIGRLLDRKITGRANRARNVEDKIPDALTATAIYLFSLRRARAFRRMLALRRAGVAVITDRYPQVAVPGFFDGPGLSAAKAEGAYVRLLARRERALYEWMTDFRPDLVIRLNVDLETAFARKPDHRYESLRAKVAAAPLLTFKGAPIVELNSRDPLDTVIAAAKAAIRETLALPA